MGGRVAEALPLVVAPGQDRAVGAQDDRADGHVVVRHDFTPTDFQNELGAYHGSAFSVAPTLAQSAYFRPHNKDARIPGLYLVGAGTHPGAGVPGVINSAKATYKLIAEEYGLRPEPFYLGLAFAALGLGISTLFVGETHGHATHDHVHTHDGVPAAHAH